jgi:hypothetical protein
MKYILEKVHPEWLKYDTGDDSTTKMIQRYHEDILLGGAPITDPQYYEDYENIATPIFDEIDLLGES